MQELIADLERVKQQLTDNSVNTSDAILRILNCLRPIEGFEYVGFLNRELLGYSNEDIDRIAEKKEHSATADLVISGSYSTFSQGDELTIDRVLPGLKVEIEIAEDGTITVADESRVSTIFCSCGIIEIEQLLSKHPELYAAVDYDESTNCVFMCKTKHLKRLNDSLRKKICRFLDDTIAEIRIDSTCFLDKITE
ncbi:MAG: hypothetical protein P4L53_16550 [Candidatus Obscuribacterales bacterium]|nr:hypothetical protein [Candidatus Obscuribacterales bacterium]